MTSPASSLGSIFERNAAEHLLHKRSGKAVPWETQRVVRAISLAIHDVRTGTTDNPNADNPVKMYGLNLADYSKAIAIAYRVEQIINAKYYIQGTQPNIGCALCYGGKLHQIHQEAKH